MYLHSGSKVIYVVKLEADGLESGISKLTPKPIPGSY